MKSKSLENEEKLNSPELKSKNQNAGGKSYPDFDLSPEQQLEIMAEIISDLLLNEINYEHE